MPRIKEFNKKIEGGYFIESNYYFYIFIPNNF